MYTFFLFFFLLHILITHYCTIRRHASVNFECIVLYMVIMSWFHFSLTHTYNNNNSNKTCNNSNLANNCTHSHTTICYNINNAEIISFYASMLFIEVYLHYVLILLPNLSLKEKIKMKSKERKKYEEEIY